MDGEKAVPSFEKGCAENRVGALSLGKTIAFTAAATALGTLSGIATLSVFFMFAASIFFAAVFSTSKYPAVLLAAPIISATALFLLSRDAAASLIPAFSFAVLGTVVGICLEKKVSFFGTVISATVTALIFSLLSALYFIFQSYGNIISGASEFLDQLFSSTNELMKAAVSAAGSNVTVTEQQITEALVRTFNLMPAFIAVFFEVISAVGVLLTFLLARKIKNDKTSHPIAVGKDPVAAVVFISAGILALILSSFQTENAFYFTVTNVIVVMFPAMLTVGISMIVKRTRETKAAARKLGPNTIVIRPSVTMLWPLLILLLFFDLLLPLVIVSFGGAFGIVKDEIVKPLISRNRDK